MQPASKEVYTEQVSFDGIYASGSDVYIASTAATTEISVATDYQWEILLFTFTHIISLNA